MLKLSQVVFDHGFALKNLQSVINLYFTITFCPRKIDCQDLLGTFSFNLCLGAKIIFKKQPRPVAKNLSLKSLSEDQTKVLYGSLDFVYS